MNDSWINQEVIPNKLNVLDLTGYVQKGNNMLFAGFPFTIGKKLFAARLIVEYYNYDRIELATDSSWLTVDSYTNPSIMRAFPIPVPPVVAEKPLYADSINYSEFKEWVIQVPVDALEKVNNIYMRIKYSGDRAELYNGYMLSDDDYNSHAIWNIGLNRQEHSVEGKSLNLVIYKQNQGEKIFYDLPVDGTDQIAEIKNMVFESEKIEQIK